MAKFEVTVDDVVYQIEQHPEYEGLFYVVRDTDMHKLARRDDGTWSYIDHSLLSRGFDLERMSKEIENHLQST
ncbi:hypothetical protein WAE58_21640 [Pedobacter panaciterrae]|uniref:Uncharacterized protein n=1 Tax=Pedobacter panaciterrae TaxID=363849 RepID=A0ABU8NT16_9SPHI